MKKVSLLTISFLLVVIQGLYAQEEIQPVTKTFAIKDAYIVQKPGQILSVGTVVIKNGLIESVGTNVSIPFNAKVLEADSMYVYAGFIDGLSHVGIPMPESKNNQGSRRNMREKDAANPSYEKAGIQPHLAVRDLLNPKDKSISDMRKLGFTAAHVVPRGKMLPGGGSLILLNGQKADDFIFQDDLSIFAQLQGAGGVYPATTIAVMSKFRELYHQAEQSKDHITAYKRNPAGMARPGQDRVLQAFHPVINKSQKVFFAAPNIKDIHRVFTLQKELNFPLVLADVKQGWHLADKIKSTRTPVLLSLDLPKDKSKKAKETDKKKEGDEKKEVEKKVKPVKQKAKKASTELTAFQKRQQESLKQYNAQAATFQDMGITFGFTSINTKSSTIKANLRKMMEHGLKEESALAALTTIPAQQLGVSKSMGTIEKGKIANLVVSDKPYFEEKSNVRFVLVEGKVFEYEVKKKKPKKEGLDTPVKVAGTWNYSIDVAGTSTGGTLKLSDDGGNISGVITNDQADGPADIEDVELDGNELTFAVPMDDTGNVKVTITVTIEEDEMEGTVNIPGMGSADMEGSRIPE